MHAVKIYTQLCVLQVVLPRAVRLLGLLEPALERVVYEDLPANLLALKHRVEMRKAAEKVAELEAEGAVMTTKPFRHLEAIMPITNLTILPTCWRSSTA